MTPADLQVEIRARRPDEVVVLAARLVQERPLPLLAAWAVQSAATVGLGLALIGVADLDPELAVALVLPLAGIFSPLLLLTAGQLVFSPGVSLAAVLGELWRRGPRFAAAFVLSRLAVLLGASMLILPGLYAWRAGWFLAPVVLLERAPLGASLSRAARVAGGHQTTAAWHGLHAVALCLYLSLAAASLLHFGLVELFGPTFSALAQLPQHDAYGPVLALCGYALAAPLVSLVWFLVYLDIRIRREGWDLEIAFRRRAALLERTHG